MNATDAPSRQTAVQELDKNILVLAGAGTGKTTLLIERLMGLILVKEVPVERIVALTFTKKAGGEIRERLEMGLRSVIDAKGAGNERNTLLAQKALDNIPKAMIGTIHSFAGHLLRLFPVQAGVDPQFKEDEGNVFDGVFEETWRDWLMEELSEEGERPTLWRDLLKRIDLGELKELARAVAWPEIELDELNGQVDLTGFLADAVAKLDGLIARFGIPKGAPVFSGRMERLRTLLSSPRCTPEEKGLLMADVEKMNVNSGPRDWKDNPWAKEGLGEVLGAAKAFAQADDGLVSRALEAIVPMARQVRQELRRRGAVSFSGLLVFSRNLLRDYPLVRNEIKKMYDAFLIDEFQDTDPLQGEIIFYLAEALGQCARHWREVRLGAGRLFVVGDPKQSIYRFRGADIAAFEEFKNLMLSQGAEDVVLTSNFRSHSQILDAVNQTFSRVMRPEPFLQPSYSAIQSGLNGEKRPGAEIWVVDCEKDAPSSSDLRRFEAVQIARWVRDHVGTSVGGKNLEYRDVALLFRSSFAFDLYVEALKEQGIPYIAEGEKTFFKRPEISFLFNLLSAVADPENHLALVGVLRTPVGGLSDNEITELNAIDGLDYRRSPEKYKDRLAALYELLRYLNQSIHLLSVGEIIRHIFDHTWILEILSSAPQGEQAIANLTKVCQMAEKWQKDDLLTLVDFINRFEDFFESSADEGESPLADSLVDAVKVMTIHKAKGLEFPVVFLPNLSAPRGSAHTGEKLVFRDWRRGVTGIHLPGARVMNSAMVFLQGTLKRREEAEEVRVFYVAMTRARERLILMLRNAKDSARSIFGGLLRQAGVTLESAPFLPVEPLLWKECPPSAAARSDEALPCPNAASIGNRIIQRRQYWSDLRDQRRFLSPSLIMKEDEKWRVKRTLHDGEDISAVDLGILCHKVMELWDFSTPDHKKADSLAVCVGQAARILEFRGPDPRAQHIIKAALRILGDFFQTDSYQRLARAKIIGREVPFMMPAPLSVGLGTGVMRGVIDLIYELNGQMVIADYKTQAFSHSNHNEKPTRYQVQADVYRSVLLKTTGQSARFEIISLKDGRTWVID